MINCTIRGLQQELDLSNDELSEISITKACDQLVPIGKWLAPMVCRLHDLIRESLENGEGSLVEGGQGRFLSNDCAPSYPSCTSSITTSNAVFAGLGLEMRRDWIGEIIGVLKAYQTAVGNHPMPSYIRNEYQDQIQRVGDEFGATTGRKRDCCWLIAAEAAEAARFCDVIYVTKLDVLTSIPSIPIATSLDSAGHGVPLEELPDTWAEYMECRAIYGINMTGWNIDISGIRRIADLPQQARDYLAKITEITGKKIIGVGVGPDREQYCT